jgi:hypothetical protein
MRKLKQNILLCVMAVFLLTGFSIAQTSTITGTTKYSDNNTPIQSGIVIAYYVDRTTGTATEVTRANIVNGSYTLIVSGNQPLDLVLFPNSEGQDFASTYYPNVQTWEPSLVLFPNSEGADITAERIEGPDNTGGITLSGKIENSGKGLNNVTISVKQNGRQTGMAVTDQSGNFRVNGLNEGSYEIIASKFGYSSVIRTTEISTSNNNLTIRLNKNGITSAENLNLKNYQLLQNYPNPFNPSTLISYQIPSSGLVKLSVYDMNGRMIKELINTYQNSGSYSINFNASEYSSGAYYYKLNVNGNQLSRSMLLIK